MSQEEVALERQSKDNPDKKTPCSVNNGEMFCITNKSKATAADNLVKEP